MKKKSVNVERNKKMIWNASFLDIVTTKLSVLFFTLFLVTLFPQLASQDWKWGFLIISLILAIKPLNSYFKK